VLMVALVGSVYGVLVVLDRWDDELATGVVLGGERAECHDWVADDKAGGEVGLRMGDG
jgi:hypothetical protein